MPKKKARGQQRCQDFKKIKNKVGKKKIVANATSTDFRTRNIHLSSQLSAKDHSELLTARKQSLADLLPRLHHHNISARRQALEGIKELAEIAWHDQRQRKDQIKQQLALVLNECCKLMVDPDPSVRSSLISLISLLLTQNDVSTIQPHTKLIVIYICNAMTHIQKDIRSQSLDFLNLLSSHVPSLIRDFTADLIPNYLYLLKLASRTVSNSTTSANPSQDKAKSGGSNARLKIISSFLKYLQTILYEKENSNAVFKMAPAAVKLFWVDGYAYSSDNLKVTPSVLPLLSVSTQTGLVLPLYDIIQKNGSNSNGENDVQGNWWHSLKTEAHYSELAIQLTPLLLDYWMEASPTEYPNSTDNLLMMQRILEILALVHSNCHALEEKQAPAVAGCFSMLQRYVLTHFPFSERNIRLPGNRVAVDLSEKFNYSVCLMTKRFITTKELSSPWTVRIIEYLITCFENEKSDIQPLLDIVEHYFSLVMTQASQCHFEQNTNLWEAFTDYFVQLPVMTPAKISCLNFIHKIFQLKFSSMTTSKWLDDKIEQQWLCYLPRLLFKLKAKSLHSMKEQILDILIEYAVHIRSESMQHLFDEIQAFLVPFFYASASGKEFFGPFCTTPSHLQRKAVFITHYFSRLSTPLLNALVMCCRSPQRLKTDIIIQMLEMIHSRQSCLSIPEFLSFLLNVIMATGVVQDSWPHQVIVASQEQLKVVTAQVCQIISLLEFKSICIHILGPSICYLFKNNRVLSNQKEALYQLYSACVHYSTPQVSSSEVFSFLVGVKNIIHEEVMENFKIAVIAQ